MTQYLDEPTVFERRQALRSHFFKRAIRSLRLNKSLDVIRKIWASSRRRRMPDNLRRQAANSGHSLGDLTDVQPESALTRGERGIEKMPFLATLYLNGFAQVKGVVVDTLTNPALSSMGRENSVESLCSHFLPAERADSARAAVNAR